MGIEGRPTAFEKCSRYGAMNASSSRNSEICASSSGSRLASSGSRASHTVACGSETRSTGPPPGKNYTRVILPWARRPVPLSPQVEGYAASDSFRRQ